LHRVLPLASAIDGLAIYFQPFPYLEQSFLHYWRNLTRSIGTYIEQEIPSVAYNIREKKDKGLGGAVISDILIPVIAEGKTDAEDYGRIGKLSGRRGLAIA
jgi:hypothetical protein